MPAISFNDSQWQSRGDMELQISADGESAALHSRARQDWWRTPPHSEPESDVDRRTGPTLTRPVTVKRWTAGVWLHVELDERFKQAALFVHAGEPGTVGASWLKLGIEKEGGRENIGCVVTDPFSDWSTSPSPHPMAEHYWLYAQVARVGPDVHCHWALQRGSADGPPAGVPKESELVQAREVRGFALSAAEEPWHVGIMACGPLSEQTRATFAHFQLDEQ